uniref:hypothetical protein n=1 Tax=Lactococcus garvieae TaxID=1363 RepID=UPI00359C260F
MSYEVMETRYSKIRSGREKIRKYQFDTREEAKNFAHASPHHTQIYKKEINKNIYELKQRIEREKSRKKYWDRKIQSWTTDFKEEKEESKLK